MKLFFDNCTSPVLASTLDGYIHHFGHQAIHIKDLSCGRHAADEVWLDFLHRDQAIWVVITGDGRLAKNKALRAAFRAAGLIGFVLAPAHQKIPMYQVASNLLWRWPEVAKLMEIVGGPALYQIPMNRHGKLTSFPL